MLIFPGTWRFRSPTDARFINSAFPDDAVRDCISLIMKIAGQGDRQDILEHFKSYFCAAAGASHNRSSSASWAESDLWTYARKAAANAPLFIEAFYDACKSLSEGDASLWAPDIGIINELLATHNIGYVVNPPRLDAREHAASMVEVASPPPTLAERAVELLQASLTRSEDLLSQGHGREAVQESLWLLETVSTAFRGMETETGTVEGKYFNTIVKDLRTIQPDSSMRYVLDWVTTLHGYLSSPTGGGVRHGLDLNMGVLITDNEARLFCNLIRSYLSFLLIEHERLSARR